MNKNKLTLSASLMTIALGHASHYDHNCSVARCDWSDDSDHYYLSDQERRQQEWQRAWNDEHEVAAIGNKLMARSKIILQWIDDNHRPRHTKTLQAIAYTYVNPSKAYDTYRGCGQGREGNEATSTAHILAALDDDNTTGGIINGRPLTEKERTDIIAAWMATKGPWQETARIAKDNQTEQSVLALE